MTANNIRNLFARSATMTAAVTLTIIFAGLTGLVAGWKNVALTANGATCKANNAIRDAPCMNAINGLLWFTEGWNAVGQGVGIWIQVNFPQEYVLTYGRLMQPFGNGETSRKVKLSFSDESFLEEHLTRSTNTNWRSYSGQHWNEFSLDHIVTSFVRIEVLTVYSTHNNGFIEVEFYTGINPCRMFYTYLNGKCYRYVYRWQYHWSEARQLCQHEGGDLVNLDTETELTTVVQWLNKGVNYAKEFWVRNSELIPSENSFPDIPLSGDTGRPLSVNRTVLNKPSVSRHFAIETSLGTLTYKTGDTLLSSICEAEPSYDEWRYVSSEDDADAEEPIVPAALNQNRPGTSSAVVGYFSFCVIAVLVLTVVIIAGGYHFHRRLRMLGATLVDNEQRL